MLTPEEIQIAKDFSEIAKGCTCKLSPDALGRLNQIDRSCPFCNELDEISKKLSGMGVVNSAALR